MPDLYYLTYIAGNWDRLPAKEKQEKEMFLSGEQRASKGFMSQANTQMELLYNMSEAEPVAKCLCDPSLAKRTAAAVSCWGGREWRRERKKRRREGERWWEKKG